MVDLLELPVDVILLIFKELSGWELLTRVRFVCRKFNSIVTSEILWNSKLKNNGIQLSHCRRKQPNCPLRRNFLAIEKEKYRWCRGKALGCDSLIGSRDRNISVWDISRLLSDVPQTKILTPLATSDDCHTGWIWDVSPSTNNTFYTCGWDQKLKYWNLAEASIEENACTSLSSAVFCVANDENMVITGEFNHMALVMDPRNDLQIIATLESHRKAILDLTFESDSNYIYTCCLDRKIRSFDKRTWNVVSSFEFPNTYAASLSLNEGELACATTHGVYMFDANDLSTGWELDPEFRSHVLRVKLNKGSLMGFTRCRNFFVSLPGHKPTFIERISDSDTEYSSFDYYKGVLAVSYAEGSVTFIKPVEVRDDRPFRRLKEVHLNDLVHQALW